ncbi:hypothetical protein Acsp02_23610 [Actinoplanes sp. NBRC 103695]|nr:hypothetical protein Acsp02_23610 [Actinoplanes sp. NBRC 103695]
MTLGTFLVDDQRLVRDGLRMMIEAQDDLRVVGEAGDGREAVTKLRDVAADVVLMDVRMPVMDGVEATRRLTRLGHPARVLILTTFDLDEYVFSALRAGAAAADRALRRPAAGRAGRPRRPSGADHAPGG